MFCNTSKCYPLIYAFHFVSTGHRHTELHYHKQFFYNALIDCKKKHSLPHKLYFLEILIFPSAIQS